MTAARPLLFTPITLRGVTARNRVVVSPMCQYVSVDGGPTDWQFVHFGRYAMGGAGIVFGEETAVEARGRKTYHCAGIWNDHQARAYRRITDFIKEMGAVPAIQLGHCGRNAGSHGAMEEWRALDERDARAGMPPWRGLAPSPLPARRGFPVPIEMDHDDIRTVLAAFRDAARRATDAGYDICEIHGAHGYLIHQFLSPVSNRRTDAYGGSRENRMRFALEVAETVRAAWPQDRPLFFRVSAVDGKGGLVGPRRHGGAGARTARARHRSGGLLIRRHQRRVRHGAGAARARLSGAIRIARAPRDRHHDHGGRADHRTAQAEAGAAGGPRRPRGDGARTDDPRRLAVARSEGIAGWPLRPDGAIHRPPAAPPRRTGSGVCAGQRGGDPGGADRSEPYRWQ